MEKRELQFIIDEHEKNFMSVAIRLIRVPYYLKIKKILKRNEGLKTKRKHDKCYILGLGPSLKDLKLSKITDGDIFALNAFYKNENAKKIKPLIYVMLDWRLYKEPIHIETRKKAIEMFPETNFVLNGKYYDSGLDGDNIYWICTWGSEKLSRNLNLSKIAPSFDNVMNLSIYLAMAMGYKEIILLGCDFNSFAFSKKIHSYGVENRSLPLSLELFMYSFVSENHYKLAAYAKEHNISIINATVGSLLDAYERDDSISRNLM